MRLQVHENVRHGGENVRPGQNVGPSWLEKIGVGRFVDHRILSMMANSEKFSGCSGPAIMLPRRQRPSLHQPNPPIKIRSWAFCSAANSKIDGQLGKNIPSAVSVLDVSQRRPSWTPDSTRRDPGDKILSWPFCRYAHSENDGQLGKIPWTR